MLSILLAVLVLAEPSGRLCIGQECSATTTATIAVKPADQERRYFWISDDAKTAYAGVIAAKADSIVLDPEAFSALDTAIDALDVTMTLGPSELGWKWTLDREEAKRLQRFYVPRGTYALTVTAEHHRTLRQQVAAGAKPTPLELRLVPLPVARGIVVDAEDRTIAGATVSLPDGTLCATTNDQGAFTCELPEKLPNAIVVSSSGYALREVRIIRHELRDIADLGRIQLSKGHLLTVKVVRSDAAPGRVAVFPDRPHLDPPKLKSIAIAEREETVRFDVSEGPYVVFVQGDGPLERIEKRVTIKDADVEEEILIEPFELVGSVEFGGTPLQTGQIEFTGRGNMWRVPLPITAGAFGVTMWQKGSAGGWVSGPELSQSEFFRSPELGENPSKWDIRIEKRMIVGRVFDAATKAAVPGAEMAVEADMGNSQSFFPASIRPDGTYEVLAADAGTYKLQVETPEHVAYATELRITADDRIRTHDIALERGVRQPIEVTTMGGAPVSKVLVHESGPLMSGEPKFVARVEDSGRFEVRGMPGASRLLYVSQLGDSFAVARVRLPRTNADVRPLQIVIPPVCCSLRIRSVTRNGNPVRGTLLFRYNGEFVPGVIVGAIAVGSKGEALLRRLPAGTYEIWLLSSEEDELQLLNSNGTSREPVRVGLSGGEETVTVVANY